MLDPRELANNRSTMKHILSLFDILTDVTNEDLIDILVSPETTKDQVIDSIKQLKSAGKIITIANLEDNSRILVKAIGS